MKVKKCELCKGSGITAKDSDGNSLKCESCNGEGWYELAEEIDDNEESKLDPMFVKLSQHVGHAIEIVGYGIQGRYQNISIECVDCNEVLYDVEREEE